jgi:cytochrome c551/c552
MDHEILGVEVSEDGMKVRIAISNPQQYHIHRISLLGIREKTNSHELIHPDAYYTLNEIPSGAKMTIKPKPVLAEVKSETTKTVAKPAANPKSAEVSKPAVNQVPDEKEIKSLLAKNTCSACHNATKKQIGPAYVDVAKRKYSDERIVELIYRPEPQNWPDYATPMPAMPQVKREDALKIARWINSLDD